MPNQQTPALRLPPPFDDAFFAGVDPSLTSCGVTLLGSVNHSAVLGQSGVTKLRLDERVGAVTDLAYRVMSTICWHGQHPELVLIEGPDVSRPFGGLVERVELIYELTRRLLDRGIPVGWVPSPIIKGYATGKGGGKNAKKAVLDAAQTTWPDLKIKKTDQADSAFLAAMAADVMGAYRWVPDEQAAAWLYRDSIEYPPSVVLPEVI